MCASFISLHAQVVDDLTVMEGALEGMFEIERPIIFIPEDNPPPPVPLDGGLTALLLAGGAAGYRQYKKRKG